MGASRFPRDSRGRFVAVAPAPEFLSLADAAAQLGLSVQSLWRLVGESGIVARRTAGGSAVPLSELARVERSHARAQGASDRVPDQGASDTFDASETAELTASVAAHGSDLRGLRATTGDLEQSRAQVETRLDTLRTTLEQLRVARLEAASAWSARQAAVRANTTQREALAAAGRRVAGLRVSLRVAQQLLESARAGLESASQRAAQLQTLLDQLAQTPRTTPGSAHASAALSPRLRALRYGHARRAAQSLSAEQRWRQLHARTEQELQLAISEAAQLSAELALAKQLDRVHRNACDELESRLQVWRSEARTAH